MTPYLTNERKRKLIVMMEQNLGFVENLQEKSMAKTVKENKMLFKHIRNKKSSEGYWPVTRWK